MDTTHLEGIIRFRRRLICIGLMVPLVPFLLGVLLAGWFYAGKLAKAHSDLEDQKLVSREIAVEREELRLLCIEHKLIIP